MDNYKGYVGFKRGTHIKFNILPKQELTVLNDKKQFGKILMDNDIKTPEVIASSSSRNLIATDKNYENLNETELKDQLCRLANAHEVKEIFVKPNDGVNGYDSFKLNPFTEQKKLDKLHTLMESTDFIFQKVIEQHDLLNALNDSSINTARMHVYYNGKEAEIVSGLLRIGVAGMEVDNGSSGGMFIPIDFETWTLEGKAQRHLKMGGRKYEKHPDSNIKLDGYKLPFKEETFDILKKTGELFKGKIVGWDVAFTPDGPMIIEGNYTFDLFMCQKSCKGFYNHPRYKEIFLDYI